MPVTPLCLGDRTARYEISHVSRSGTRLYEQAPCPLQMVTEIDPHRACRIEGLLRLQRPVEKDAPVRIRMAATFAMDLVLARPEASVRALPHRSRTETRLALASIGLEPCRSVGNVIRERPQQVLDLDYLTCKRRCCVGVVGPERRDCTSTELAADARHETKRTRIVITQYIAREIDDGARLSEGTRNHLTELLPSSLSAVIREIRQELASKLFQRFAHWRQCGSRTLPEAHVKAYVARLAASQAGAIRGG